MAAGAKLSESVFPPHSINSLRNNLARVWHQRLMRPRSAFEVFEFDLPVSPADQKLVASLMVFYGARDIFMAAAVYAAAYSAKASVEGRKALGWILIAGSAVVYVDGAVVKMQVGKRYAPMLMVVGAMVLGVFDEA